MPPTPKKTVKTETRQVIYPEIDAKICAGPDAVTQQQAKDLLGWEEETDDVKFGADYFLMDENKKKIRCHNNVRNRPFNEGHSRTLAQDLLNLHWRMNGETVVIGSTGRVLSGQHRLIALVLACQMWENQSHWKSRWRLEPTLETIVVMGVQETEDVTRTLDNVRPRTLGDVLFTSDALAKVKTVDRKSVARMLDYAVRLLWDRTGARKDAYAPRRTHSESLDFLDLHPSVMKCVKHIYEEDQEGSIGKLVSPGTVAALMYLMASSGTDPRKYRDSENPSEKSLDLGNWDKAEEFWTLFSARSDDLKPLREAIGMLASEDTGIGGTPDEKIALVAKAWSAFAEVGKVEKGDLKLSYRTQDDVRYLADFPTFGGIDCGKPGKEDDEEEDKKSDPTPEEVEAEKVRIREEKEAKSKKGAKAAKDGPKDASQDADPKDPGEKAETKAIVEPKAPSKPAPAKAKTPAAQVSSKKGPKFMETTMKISCPVCSRELDTVEADYIPGHQNNNTLMPCIGGDRTLAESKASLKTLKAMRKAAKLAKTGIGGELARVSGTATGRSRLTVYQLEAKQTVAEYFGLSFDQVDLPYDEWAALREKYTKESGKQL